MPAANLYASLGPLLGQILSILLEPWVGPQAYILGNSIVQVIIIYLQTVTERNSWWSDWAHRFRNLWREERQAVLVQDPRYIELVSEYIAEHHPETVSAWCKTAEGVTVANFNHRRGFTIQAKSDDGVTRPVTINASMCKRGDNYWLYLEYPLGADKDAIIRTFGSYRSSQQKIRRYCAHREPGKTQDTRGEVKFTLRVTLPTLTREQTAYPTEIEAVMDEIDDWIGQLGPRQRLPATILEGLPGTGKTTLVDLLPKLRIFYLDPETFCNTDLFQSTHRAMMAIVQPDELFYVVIEEMDKITSLEGFQVGLWNNFLDGHYSSPGQITIVTCNHTQWMEIDDSMTRAGRARRYYMGAVSDRQLRALTALHRPDLVLPERELVSQLTLAQLLEALPTASGVQDLLAPRPRA